MTEKHQTDHHDKAFFDTFMVVLGALALITLAILFLARGIHAETAGVYVQESEFAQDAVAARIAPVGEVRHAGDAAVSMGGGDAMTSGAGHNSAMPMMEDHAAEPMMEAAAAPMMPMPEAAAAPMAAASADGSRVYNTACVACHGAGIAGAPRVGDVDAWAPRIEQGLRVLSQHAIDGYQGTSGFMPAKGGNVSLSDAEVNAAVEYMVEQSQ